MHLVSSGKNKLSLSGAELRRLNREKDATSEVREKWMDLRDASEVKSTELHDGLLMEFECGVKDESNDFDLQK